MRQASPEQIARRVKAKLLGLPDIEIAIDYWNGMTPCTARTEYKLNGHPAIDYLFFYWEDRRWVGVADWRDPLPLEPKVAAAILREECGAIVSLRHTQAACYFQTEYVAWYKQRKAKHD